MKTRQNKTPQFLRNGALGLAGLWATCSNGLSMIDSIQIGVHSLPEDGLVSEEDVRRFSGVQKALLFPLSTAAGTVYTIAAVSEYNTVAEGRAAFAKKCGPLMTHSISGYIEQSLSREASIAFDVNQAVIGAPGAAVAALLTGFSVGMGETLTSGRAKNMRPCLHGEAPARFKF